MNGRKLKTTDIVYIAVCASLMAICSWISIPMTVPFTLQTFAVFLTVGILGGKIGTITVLIYILLGAVGVPVFSGFAGGLQVLIGPTGGYIVGFILSALVMWGIEKVAGKKLWILGISMVLGLIVCYVFGTIWFMVLYASQGKEITLAMALGWCVIPFIIPDIIKIALALFMSKALRRAIKYE